MQEYAGYVLLAVGIVVLLTGICLFFWVQVLSELVWLDQRLQFILLNPGPIASIGLSLVLAGSQASICAYDRIQKYVEKLYSL